MLLPPALGFSPHPPVSVYGTGPLQAIAAFLDAFSPCFATLSSLRIRSKISLEGFASPASCFLTPVFPFLAHGLITCPHSSVITEYRNFNLLSIDYDSRPRLRSRLTQGRSALPWKPWIFGLEDSHFNLATHSGILSSIQSTAPYRYRFAPYAMLLYQRTKYVPKLRWCVLAPDIFGAGPLD